MEFKDFADIGKKLFTGIGRQVNPDLLTDFYERFGELTQKQWEYLCVSYRKSTNEYPTLQRLEEAERNNRQAQTGEAQTIMVECECGRAIVVPLSVLSDIRNVVYCPGRFYGLCKRTFDVEHLRNMKPDSRGMISFMKPKAELPSYHVD